MSDFGSTLFGSAARVLLVLGAIVLIATAVWVVAAWGAFRQSLAASRAQAWLATTLWIAIVAALVWVPTRIA